MSAETKEAFCGLHPKMTIGIFSLIVNQSVSTCVLLLSTDLVRIDDD